MRSASLMIGAAALLAVLVALAKEEPATRQAEHAPATDAGIATATVHFHDYAPAADAGVSSSPPAELAKASRAAAARAYEARGADLDSDVDAWRVWTRQTRALVAHERAVSELGLSADEAEAARALLVRAQQEERDLRERQRRREHVRDFERDHAALREIGERTDDALVAALGRERFEAYRAALRPARRR
jgi:hypothetical protein